jgi:hypothetical protein
VLAANAEKLNCGRVGVAAVALIVEDEDSVVSVLKDRLKLDL